MTDTKSNDLQNVTKTYIKKIVNLIRDYIEDKDWRVRENSNTGYSIQGLSNHIVSYNFALFWLNEIYDKEIAKAHNNGFFHIHDLGYLTTYCCGWDLKDLLIRGFGGVPGKIKSRPPKHLASALGQAWNFLYSLQGEAAGAQAFSSFDTYLAPFVELDNLSYVQVKQLIEEFIYNMNVPSRLGFQTPFTNITMDLNVPSFMKNEPIIYGGKPHPKYTYGMFQHGMDLINKAFCEVMMEGDANHRIFSFPIPTYNITKDFNWDNPNLEPLWEMTAKYGIPYFANYVNSDMNPEDARSMCCRLRIDNRELIKRGGGLFGSNPLTGSIGVVTLNLPKIAYVSYNKKDFFYNLKELMKLAKKSLLIKREIIEQLTERDLYPYSKIYLSDIKRKTGSYWGNHFNTIGLVGMNECIRNLTAGRFNIVSKKGQNIAKQILSFMRETLVEFQLETGKLFNLEATPAEGTSFRLAKKDKQKYKNIITAGTESSPYYTNSSQLPVGYTNDIFEALKLQDELQCMYTGGTVLHLFLGERIDADAAKLLIKKITTDYGFKLPYISITPTFSICPEHGYIIGEYTCCPHHS